MRVAPMYTPGTAAIKTGISCDGGDLAARIDASSVIGLAKHISAMQNLLINTVLITSRECPEVKRRQRSFTTAELVAFIRESTRQSMAAMSRSSNVVNLVAAADYVAHDYCFSTEVQSGARMRGMHTPDGNRARFDLNHTIISGIREAIDRFDPYLIDERQLSHGYQLEYRYRRFFSLAGFKFDTHYGRVIEYPTRLDIRLMQSLPDGYALLIPPVTTAYSGSDNVVTIHSMGPFSAAIEAVSRATMYCALAVDNTSGVRIASELKERLTTVGEATGLPYVEDMVHSFALEDHLLNHMERADAFDKEKDLFDHVLKPYGATLGLLSFIKSFTRSVSISPGVLHKMHLVAESMR